MVEARPTHRQTDKQTERRKLERRRGRPAGHRQAPRRPSSYRLPARWTDRPLRSLLASRPTDRPTAVAPGLTGECPAHLPPATSYRTPARTPDRLTDRARTRDCTLPHADGVCVRPPMLIFTSRVATKVASPIRVVSSPADIAQCSGSFRRLAAGAPPRPSCLDARARALVRPPARRADRRSVLAMASSSSTRQPSDAANWWNASGT